MELNSVHVGILAVVGLVAGVALYLAPVQLGRRFHTALLALGVLGLFVVLAERGWQAYVAG